MLETQPYDCPYCGEPAEALLDLSGGDQQYIEDCHVCCRPILITIHYSEEGSQVTASRENG